MKISYNEACANNQENDYLYLINNHAEWNILKRFDLKNYSEWERNFESYSNNFCIPGYQTITINKRIFCFGNEVSFILDIATLKTELIIREWSSNCYFSGIAYLSNCIYIFILDQERSNDYNVVEKYNLALHKWTKVANFPMPSATLYCLTFKHNILIYNHSRTIFQYDVNMNSHSVLLEMVKDLSKIIASGNSRLYIIESKGRIYESDVENQYAFNSIGESNADFTYIQFSWANYQGSTYFGLITRNYFQRTYTYSYYRFSLNNKTIVKINHKKWNLHTN